MNEQEPKFCHQEKPGKRKRKESETFEPEEAFLKIGSSLRQVKNNQKAGIEIEVRGMAETRSLPSPRL